MNKLDTITRWLHVLIVTLIVWSQDRIQDMFKKLDIEDLYLLGVLILAVIAIQLTDALAVLLIDNLRWVRRLLSGKNDIEGDWVAVDIDTAEPNRIAGIEYYRVQYRRGQYVLLGDTWSPQGKWFQSYAVENSTYNPTSRTLEYYYKQGIERIGGYGIITYLPQDSLATEDICRYIDEKLKTPHVARGRRLSTKLSKVSMEERRTAALAFAKEFEKDGMLDIDAVIQQYNWKP